MNQDGGTWYILRMSSRQFIHSRWKRDNRHSNPEGHMEVCGAHGGLRVLLTQCAVLSVAGAPSWLHHFLSY